MTDLQKKLLMLMCEVDEICRRHEIEYMLFAGTALGAERHGGFIPWDDDADIIMTLPNYEKFLSIIGEEIKEDRAIDCLEMDSDYILSYARYVDLTSTAIQRHTLFRGCHLGVKLDIFCVVPTFEDEELIEKHRTDILAFTEVICTTGRMMTYRPEDFYPRYRQELSRMESAGREQYIAENLDELTHRVTGKSSKCILFSGMASNTKLYSSEIFDEVEYVPFEDTMLPVSRKNILFLEQHMGRDWMALPINVAEPRHMFLLDTEHPYADYLPKIRETIDLAKAEQACIDKKENNLYEKDIFRDVLANYQRIRNIYAAVSAEKKVSALKKEKGSPDYAALLDAYDDYYFAQLTRASKVHKLAVKLERSMFEEAMEVLISEGRYYDAEAIINASVNAGYIREDDAFALAIREKSEICRSLEETVYSHQEVDVAERILSERQELKDTVTFIAADLFLRINREMSDDDLRELYAYSKNCMEKHSSTGEITAVCGLIAEKMGNDEEAKQLFTDAMKTIRNGFLYQMLVDRGISTDIKFEAARKKEESRAKSAIYPVMKKDKAKVSPKILERASREGCNSLTNRMRYSKYRKWSKSVKSDSEARFNDYADKLLNMKL